MQVCFPNSTPPQRGCLLFFYVSCYITPMTVTQTVEIPASHKLTIDPSMLTDFISSLPNDKMETVNKALRIALAIG
jgi:hypothetical protein